MPSPLSRHSCGWRSPPLEVLEPKVRAGLWNRIPSPTMRSIETEIGDLGSLVLVLGLLIVLFVIVWYGLLQG